jgi:uncharacterized protein YndB with AHSA1/START domain
VSPSDGRVGRLIGSDGSHPGTVLPIALRALTLLGRREAASGCAPLFVDDSHRNRVQGSKRNKLMSTNSIRLHRVLRATPDKVYRAFLDAEAMAKWLPPNGFTGKVHHMEARVGGTHKMSFTNFTTGQSHSFGGTYLELVPHERIRYSDKFDDSNLPGEMQVTITLKKVSVGTELSIVQEGVPAVIPAEACYLGWQESLVLLAKLVEADIQN